MGFETPLSALSAVYGYSRFRGVQLEAIETVLRGQDAFVLMATGGGKSLCYIIPALVLGTTAIVVSPLVSLMQDQVLALVEKGVEATYLGSAQEDPTVWTRLSSFRLVYVTPETSVTDRFRSALRGVDVCLLAIDEAHCVSEWGHDFRPEYRRLHELRQHVGTAPVLAVTATATAKCRQDIVEQLAIRGPMLMTSVDRPNLLFSAHEKPRSATEALLGTLPPSGAAIVYVQTTKDAERIALDLSAAGVSAASYHAGLRTDERTKTHHDFLRDRVRVVVATLAFGMGVDKPDVRAVVHWGVPKTIEAYYQQAGRAGRDGDPATCVLFHSPSDMTLARRLVGDDPRGLEGLQAVRAYCAAGAVSCRRNMLLQHLGEETPDACGQCDLCRQASSPGGAVDLTDRTRLLLRAIVDCQARSCGATTIVALLRGHAKYDWMAASPVKGRGSDWPATAWTALLERCRAEGLVDEVFRQPSGRRMYAALLVTAKGQTWQRDPESSLRGLPPVESQPRASARTRMPNEQPNVHGDAPPLFDRLSALRRRLATGVPAYIVCSNDALRQMAESRPRTLTDLERVPGFGKAKVAKYGQAFLDCVRDDGTDLETPLSVPPA